MSANNILELFESRAHTSNIDGLVVKDQTTLDPTIEWLLKKYNYFNWEYFNGDLPTLKSSSIEISKNNRSAAYVDWDFIHKDRNSISLEPRIVFSRFYQRTEKQCCEILLHEMVHIYTPKVLNILESGLGGHGTQFVKKVKNINSYGWDVPLFSFEGNKDKSFISIINDLSSSYLLAIEDSTKNNIYCLFALPYRFLNEIKLRSDTRLFAIKDPGYFLSVPFIDGIHSFCQDLSTNSILMYKKTNEDLENCIKAGVLKEVPTGDLLKESLTTESCPATTENLIQYAEAVIIRYENELPVYHFRIADYF